MKAVQAASARRTSWALPALAQSDLLAALPRRFVALEGLLRPARDAAARDGAQRTTATSTARIVISVISAGANSRIAGPQNPVPRLT